MAHRMLFWTFKLLWHDAQTRVDSGVLLMFVVVIEPDGESMKVEKVLLLSNFCRFNGGLVFEQF